LTGRIEVDEGYVGGPEEGLSGRLNLEKTLVVVAVQEDGQGIGRIRMRRVPDASSESLIPFVQGFVAPGSVVHTDGWLGYLPLKGNGYRHEVTYLKGKKKTASELLPRVHLVISHLKRWLLGTHQGAVSHKHLDYCWMNSRFASTGDAQRAAASSSIALLSRPWRSNPYPWIKSFIPTPAKTHENHKPLWSPESSRYLSRGQTGAIDQSCREPDIVLRFLGDLRHQVVRLDPKRDAALKSHVDTASHRSCESGRAVFNSG
jgi:hypothetical protein